MALFVSIFYFLRIVIVVLSLLLFFPHRLLLGCISVFVGMSVFVSLRLFVFQLKYHQQQIVMALKRMDDGMKAFYFLQFHHFVLAKSDEAFRLLWRL